MTTLIILFNMSCKCKCGKFKLVFFCATLCIQWLCVVVVVHKSVTPTRPFELMPGRNDEIILHFEIVSFCSRMHDGRAATTTTAATVAAAAAVTGAAMEQHRDTA